jgi:TPP-dependent pyruvate/acetoin dehydrogenase alpha subunit
MAVPEGNDIPPKAEMNSLFAPVQIPRLPCFQLVAIPESSVPMRRYPAFDPPEYLEWSPDAEVLEEYQQRLDRDPPRQAIIAKLDRGALEEIYVDLVRTRLLDIGLKRWVRQGVISKAWLGTGEEAVTVGSVSALDRSTDLVCPMIRNAGACHMMGMSLADLFRGYLATPDSPTGGRDLHVGQLESGVLQPISHMGTNVPVMAGVALAFRIRGEKRVSLTWIGDGATKSGECHEGLNLAATLDLPVVFVLQDNQVALGTPSRLHGAGDLGRWGEMYGIPTWHADGNHVLDVLAATTLAARQAREGRGPTMVIARTFRMGGHATHDEREARQTFPAQLFEEWGKRDPVGLFEEWLTRTGIPRRRLEELEEEVRKAMDEAAEEAKASLELPVDPDQALYPGISDGDVMSPIRQRPVQIS